MPENTKKSDKPENNNAVKNDQVRKRKPSAENKRQAAVQTDRIELKAPGGKHIKASHNGYGRSSHTVAKNKKKKMSTSSLVLITALVVISLAIVAMAIYYIVNTSGTPSGVLYSYTCEAGEHVSASVYALSSEHTARFPDDLDIDSLTHKVGNHKISVIIDEITYDVTLTVKDTKAPTGKAHNLVCMLGSSIKAGEMVSDIDDETQVSISFKNPPNLSVEGRQSVRIKLTDEGGNTTYIDDCFVFVASSMKVKSWEMGTPFPSPTDLCNGKADIIFQNVNDLADIKVPGTYSIPMRITVSGVSDTYYLPLAFVDTIAPKVTVKEGNVYDISDPFPAASNWISACDDATDVKFYYAYDYSITSADVYYLDIIAEDAAGNKTPVRVKITALDGKVDNFAPIINVKNEIIINVGSELVLENYVTIYDDKDGDIPLSDSERVKIEYPADLNLYLPGEYTIIITATDSSNRSSVTPVTVKVVHKDISKETSDALADEIISSVIKLNMTTEQKIQAIFDRIARNENMDFTGKSDKSNEVWREFYSGFTLSYGDSYTTACMMKTLLDKLGIDSIIIHNLTSTTYWTLVDYGDGWYHVDPFLHSSPWLVDGSYKDTLKLTDLQMSQFNEFNNEAHPGSNSYLFNSSIYPATPIYSEETGEFIYLPYRVIYLCTDGGYIEGETDQKVSHMQNCSTVIAQPRSGYRFVSWSDGVTTPERTDIIKSNLTVTAQFVESQGLFKTYVLTYEAGSGGKISGEAFQTVDAGYYGSEIVAIADNGYKFIGWSDGIMTPARKDLAKKDMTYTANFAPLSGNIYTLEYRVTDGGHIEGENFQVLDLGKGGTSVTAVPDEGYVFNMWSDGLMTPTRKDPYGSDLTVTARFVKEDSELLELQYKAQEGGTIEGLSYQRIESGSYGDTVRAVASRGYYFVAWSDGLAEVERRDLPSESKEISAIFAKLNEYRILYMISGNGGYINGDSTQYIYDGESTSEVTAVPLFGFIFKGWSDGVESATRSDCPTNDFEVTAIFEELPKYTITYKATQGGSISGKTTQTVYTENKGSSVKAVPASGYKFVSWSDGETSSERSDLVTDEDITLTAIFEKLNVYTANYSAGEHGKVSGTLKQTAYEGGTFKTVTAIADDGFEFASWSDGVTTAERTDEANSDINVEAIFVAKKVCTLYYSASTGGKIIGKSTQNILIGNSSEEVTAVAEEGYVFARWSDGVTTPTRSDVAKQDTVFYVAIFELAETK